MQTDVYRSWPSRIVTFLVCALATASAVYWEFKIWNSSSPVNAPRLAVAGMPLVAPPKAVAQALGGSLAAPILPTDSRPATSRYVLAGVVASAKHGGAALISVDGQEAKPIRVGALVEGPWVLASVMNRRAILSSSTNAATKITLELPPPNR